jgi:hypothetical protein
MRIERDDVEVGSALWNAPLPVDPGTFKLTASAPGHSAWSTEITVPNDGSTIIVTVPALQPAPGSETPDPSPAQAPAEQEPSATSDGSVPWLAIGALGVGVAGVAVGSVFGLSSKSKRDESDLYCAGSACTDPRGVDLRGVALDAGNISTIAFIIGGIGVAAGTVLWITHPSEKPQASTGLAPRVGIGPGSLKVEQSW